MRIHGWAEVDLDGLSNLRAWTPRVGARPALEKGCKVPIPVQLGEREGQDEAALETARRTLLR